jgi:FMN phosphatase YigB (HAD superfamily)
MLNAVVEYNGLRERFRGGVLSVHPAKVFKPAPAVYRLAEESLGVPRTMMAFISSNGWDAAGAKTFGFQVFWVNRSGAPLERLGVRPDETTPHPGRAARADSLAFFLERFLALLRDRRAHHEDDQDRGDDQQHEADRARDEHRRIPAREQ